MMEKSRQRISKTTIDGSRYISNSVPVTSSLPDRDETRKNLPIYQSDPVPISERYRLRPGSETYRLKDDLFIYLVLYVDDMLIAAKKKYDIQKLLSAEFEMKDLGAARKILGMEIIRDRERRKLFLSQRSYIQKVLERFGMSSSKPIDTPSAANIYLTAMFTPQSEEEKEGTSDVGLIYGGDTQCLVTGYSDSDYAGDVDTRRSMTCYVFTLGGSVVSWKATLQPTVTLSTTEAEYMALTEAAKEGIWLKGLTLELAVLSRMAYLLSFPWKAHL
uniref:Reverse transcriptase Ty1/copia-type domain-containing protein n=1 Tax=Solanum lycopersicum TaxID=4081 RepID=A0A3Q7HAN8_SOLLC